MPSEKQPPPLDFEELPKTPEEIPLERHGALLLLAARAAMAELFSHGQEIPSIEVFPTLGLIFSNFIGGHSQSVEASVEQPRILLDSLLTLTVLSMERSIGAPDNEKDFENFLLALTGCTAHQSYSSIRQFSTGILHSHPSQLTRFKLIRKVLEDKKLLPLKDSAIGWLKHEILNAAGQASDSSGPSDESNIFLDPHYFSMLLPSLFTSTGHLDISSGIIASWFEFSQTLVPSLHAALNLLYLLISSPNFRQRLQLEKSYLYLRREVLEPLKSLCHAFESDLTQNGGDGRIEAAFDMWEIGMSRSVGLISHALGQVEDAVGEAFVLADVELPEPTADDVARTETVRKETSP